MMDEAWKSFREGKLVAPKRSSPGPGATNRHKGADADLFTSRNTLSKIPDAVAQELYYNPASAVLDGKQPDAADRTREGVRHVYEIGGQNCVYLKFPGPGTLLTRGATKYGGEFRRKDPTDLEFNRYVAYRLSVDGFSGTKAPRVAKAPPTTAYAEAFRDSDPKVMRGAKPPLCAPGTNHFFAPGRLMETVSFSQAAHSLPSKEMATSFTKTWPIHALQGKLGPGEDQWQTSYGIDFGESPPRSASSVALGGSPSERKRQRQREAKAVGALLDQMGDTRRGCRSAPHFVVPVGVLGTTVSQLHGGQ